MIHTERRIKVNAWVDEGIAPVIEALNQFSEIETISSCAGDGHAYFYIRGDEEDVLYKFIKWLAIELSNQIDACCEFRLSVEWPGSHQPYGALYVSNGTAGTVSRALYEISSRKNIEG